MTFGAILGNSNMLKSFSTWMCLILGYVSPRGISLRVDAKKASGDIIDIF